MVVNMIKTCFNFGMKRLAVLLLLVVSGCGGAIDQSSSLPDVLLEPHATSSSYRLIDPDPQILEAAAAWNEALGLDIFKVESGFAEITVTYFEKEKNPCDRDTDCTAVVVSYNLREVTAWKCDLALNNNTSIKSIKHELGHCLGLDHSLNPNSVMYYQAGDDITESAIDLILNNIAFFPFLQNGVH